MVRKCPQNACQLMNCSSTRKIAAILCYIIVYADAGEKSRRRAPENLVFEKKIELFACNRAFVSSAGFFLAGLLFG